MLSSEESARMFRELDREIFDRIDQWTSFQKRVFSIFCGEIASSFSSVWGDRRTAGIVRRTVEQLWDFNITTYERQRLSRMFWSSVYCGLAGEGEEVGEGFEWYGPDLAVVEVVLMVRNNILAQPELSKDVTPFVWETTRNLFGFPSLAIERRWLTATKFPNVFDTPNQLELEFSYQTAGIIGLISSLSPERQNQILEVKKAVKVLALDVYALLECIDVEASFDFDFPLKPIGPRPDFP